DTSIFIWFPAFVLALFFIVQMAADFVLCQLHYMIPEESKHGTFVGRIAQDLGLQISDINSRRLRISSKDGSDYFQVNLKNGILFVNRMIDREALCPEISVCIVQLEVIVDKPVQIHHVDVEIEDINDNYPIFPAKEYKLLIAESRLPGSNFPLEGAVDSDVGTNSVTVYELSSNDNFALDVQSYTHESKSVQLVLKKSLDREQIPFHNITLIAFDGGKPKLNGSAQLLITVQDVNDNAPVFEQSIYRASLLENALVGTFVIKVNATDLDEGENGKLKYSFNKLVPPQTRSVFNIEEHTGIIRSFGEVDYEKKSLYEIEVDAIDKGPYAIAGHCKVIVNIVDVNDNPPEMTVTSLNVPVPEDSPTGTVVAVISVHDRDSDQNGKVTCHISKNIPFKISPTLREYYSLTVDGPLDRERTSEYELDITATDGGAPALSVTKSIKVQISDVNDNPPSFQKSSEIISVKENNPPGSHVYTVSASDSDTGQNSFITYSLSASFLDGIPISSYISVNPENGKIFALLSFDHEQVCYFQCQIIATDAGLPPMSSNLTLHIFIEDINDNAPSALAPFSSSESAVTEMVPRSFKKGQVVTKIKAIDPDSGYNAWISYEVKNLPRNSPFSIGHHTGEITIMRSFIDSDSDQHKLFVELKDHGDPQMSAMVTLIILLVDPEHELPAETKNHKRKANDLSDANIYLIMSICLISSVFLITLIVYTVSIDGIPMSSYISINPENGKIYALMSFDHEQIIYFQCQIIATDAGLPHLSSNLTLHIFIEDINDNAPSALAPFYSTEPAVTEMVPRSSKVGQLVTKIKAVDPDSGYNAWISYKLKDLPRNSPFSIGRQNGEIIITRSLMDSDGDKHNLNIILKDHGLPEMSTIVTLIILLTEPEQELPTERKKHKEKNDDFSDANIYLIMSICLIASIFLITLIVYTVLRWQKYTQEINALKQNTLCPSIAGSWTYSQQRQYKVHLNGTPLKNDLILFTPNFPQSTVEDGNSNTGSLRNYGPTGRKLNALKQGGGEGDAAWELTGKRGGGE
uniref:Cadherin domain-containing protein n=1 Tax=Xenopus tropicalis TaxID=8364 RepID=A0A6I8S0D6_XENTR